MGNYPASGYKIVSTSLKCQTQTQVWNTVRDFAKY
jgi:hypothetical protein